MPDSPPPRPLGTDAYSPGEIAHRVESVGVVKARTDLIGLLVLSILAGAFISLGACFFLVTVTGSELGFGVTRLLGGLAFSLGLILVVIAGAELFTGNNLVAMAWASRLVTTGELLRSWLVVYLGNVIGAVATAVMVWQAQMHGLGGGAVAETALAVAHGKAELAVFPAFARGVLCNALVCLAVWLTLGGRSLTDKVLAILFPITAFVALGLEHSIANWFFLPYGFLLGLDAQPEFLAGAARNLAVVTVGNVVGGTVLVAAVYWLAYLRPRSAS